MGGIFDFLLRPNYPGLCRKFIRGEIFIEDFQTFE
jgi:hypothetical protein